jgi:hypothetical protein
MLFVDGENLTIRGQRVASYHGLSLSASANWRKDAYLWFHHSPHFFGTDWMHMSSGEGDVERVLADPAAANGPGLVLRDRSR